jgi:hypothetical protein
MLLFSNCDIIQIELLNLKLMKSKSLFPVITFLLLGCQNTNMKKSPISCVVENENISSINPIKGLEIKPETYVIKTNQASTINLPTGSKIEIPADAFVDQNGNPVQGEVEIKWNEYHSLSDIMLSGIPMKYDTLGKQGDFVSGGMFTISAEHNSNKVELAEGKTAKIDIASINDTPCMNFYQLDEKSGKWNYETSKKAAPIEKNIASAKNEDITPEETIIETNVDTKNFPELNEKSIVGWKTIGGLTRKEKRILQEKTAQCKLSPSDKSNIYMLEVKYENYSKSWEVRPYFIEEAMTNTKIIEKQVDKENKELVDYQNKLANGEVVRSIEIEGFGTYNWDIVHRRENPVMLAADFIFPKKVNQKLVSLFLISPDENCVVAYHPEDYSNFSFDPKKKNCIVAILPDNSVLACGNSDFDNARKIKNHSQYDFVLKKTNIVLKNSKDLAKHLNSLI